MESERKAYFDEVAKHLCGDFESIESIDRFTDNPDVVGAYAEAKVISFLKRILDPLTISTGTIIGPQYFESSEKRPQIDAIVWDPNPIPAILEELNFALVPWNSVIGFLEIKKTDYPDGLQDIDQRLNEANSELPEGADGFMGVVCVRKTHDPSGNNTLSELRSKDKTVYLIDYEDDGISVNETGVYKLVNFVSSLRRIFKQREATFEVSYPNSTIDT